MLSLLYFASFFSIIAIINAQCVDPGFIPCYPAGSQLGGVPSDSFDDSGFWDSLQDVASLPIGRRDLANRLAARQEALCCSPDPDVECLVTNDEDIPFCYDTQTTRYEFSDSSFGYITNGTYYAADGTFVNFDKGYYSLTDGSVETFAPATSTATGPRSTRSNLKASAATATHASTAAAKQPATNTAAGGQTTAPGATNTAATQTPAQQQQKQNSGAGRGIGDMRSYVMSVAGLLLLATMGSFVVAL